MSDENEQAEPPSSPIESGNVAKKEKRWPWWLRSSIWFALGTASAALSLGFLARYFPPHYGTTFRILRTSIVAAISTLPFAVWAGIRARNAVAWKAYGFFLPLACGIIFFISIEAISENLIRRVGLKIEPVVFAAGFALLLILAEFCVRLQPSEGAWYQYSLRSLVIFMAIAGVLFAFVGDLFLHSYNQKRLMDKWSAIAGPHTRGRVIIGWSFRDISQDELIELGNETKLESLILDYQKTRFIDSNLDSLVYIDNLKLKITGQQVTDLSPLEGLTNLRFLDLTKTQVSDLSPLEGLTKLKWLDIRHTQVTEAEVQKLRQSLPNCKIMGPAL